MLEIKRIYEIRGYNALTDVAREIYEIYKKHGNGFISFKGLEREEDIINNPERYYCLVKNGEIIGVGAIMIEEGKIMRVCIKREYRGKGYGKILLAFLIGLALSKNDRAYMYVRKKNKVMLRLLRKFGFTIVEHNRRVYCCWLRREELEKSAIKIYRAKNSRK